MITQLVSRVSILTFGVLYPAYGSYKAVRAKNVKEYLKWMMYWIIFAIFLCVETFTDVLLGFWFPFYYEIKVALVFWLHSPATRGSSFLYRKFVHPALIKREHEIDEVIASTRRNGYSTLLGLGSKGLAIATNAIAQTVAKPIDTSSEDLATSLSEFSNLHSEFFYTYDLNSLKRLRMYQIKLSQKISYRHMLLKSELKRAESNRLELDRRLANLRSDRAGRCHVTGSKLWKTQIAYNCAFSSKFSNAIFSVRHLSGMVHSGYQRLNSERLLNSQMKTQSAKSA
ncbi:unnamed protein product [Nesidiocoris tenuis]|uniref:Receptor expression-enhancing protein n=1 Tax=Nesidiocoris tenuis TaxID=355587 RepID=A0A6H5HIV4_9HEMI|nr:unnamed protein product [Nesidiocoris tenuis]